MGARKIYSKGQMVGSVTYIKELPGVRYKSQPKRRALFGCRCGNTFECVLASITSGLTTSCGCYNTQILKEMALKRGCKYRRGAKAEYKVWAEMKRRCYSKKSREYHRYGGRGIKICDRWLGDDGFKNFIADMGKRPSAKHSIDRYPDNDGNYEPNNCRWATIYQQSINKRSTIKVTYNGQTKPIVEWALELGVERETLKARIFKYGWSVEDAFTYPIGPARRQRKQHQST